MIFLFFMILVMPESPQWLIKAGRIEEAKMILEHLHGKGDPTILMLLNNFGISWQLSSLNAKTVGVTATSHY